ncbi:hypothetical protein GZH47_24045 [Paenibacillus rhizovicinus]|uniref:Glycoside hydrolase family 42 N-terminal domain-containing protein n=1 Tax=Paenibacillus rhizovicinus TaxID=2704463 RepID=A0A6C0P7E1_9BACL|nr:beta-galactosidase [Paenibacillus rhizovicinus]QHW33563.1 hypothetical protein GZH47_24045 [Paenibacillus rhizovicinus]
MASNEQAIGLEGLHYVNCSGEGEGPDRITLHTKAGRSGMVVEGKPLRLGGADWQAARYLVFDVEVREEHCAVLQIDFWEEDSDSAERGDLYFIVGVLPQLTTRVAIPLEALDSQVMFQPRRPGRLKMVLFGKKVDLARVNRIQIGLAPSSFDQTIAFSNVHVSDREPEYPLPDRKLIDPLGQWLPRDWPGKVASEAAMVEQMRTYLAGCEGGETLTDFAGEWSAYGGWTGKRFDATGFFRTEHDGKRWWLVDPDGCVFYSNGLDCVTPDIECPATGIESFFEWLPEKDGEFADAWNLNHYASSAHFIDFAIVNMIRAFGPDWREAWERMTRRRLVEWGFNTIANWSDGPFIRKAKLPYVLPLNGFPETERKVFRDFPDVFSTEYQENAERFARQLEAYRDDRYLIGYFLRNEPHWAFVEGLIIAEELLANPADLVSKRELIRYLEEQYGGDIGRLNEAWRSGFGSFDDLRRPMRKAARQSTQTAADLRAFSRIMIERYVGIPSQAAKRVDPHHLNLGMRYAYMADEDLIAGYEHFDVFSINCYRMDPRNDIMWIGDKTGLPVIIGEYQFGALDRGSPATGLRGVASQEDRAKAYRFYVENAAATPYCVGNHYFVLNDQAALGRGDGENYSVGFVNICQQPHPEMVEAAQETHRTIYAVASGERQPTTVEAEEIEMIAY